MARLGAWAKVVRWRVLGRGDERLDGSGDAWLAANELAANELAALELDDPAWTEGGVTRKKR